MYISPVILADKVLQGTEKLSGTEIISMTLIGLAVVFCALLILVVFLYGSGSIFKKTGTQQPAPKKSAPPAAKKSPAPAKKEAKPAKAAAPAKPAAPAASGEDEEVIAVIIAAIAAMGAAEGKQYALRSVKQVTRGGSERSVWAQAGLMDGTRPF